MTEHERQELNKKYYSDDEYYDDIPPEIHAMSPDELDQAIAEEKAYIALLRCISWLSSCPYSSPASRGGLPPQSGITPAFAGNTLCTKKDVNGDRDHPRACGEYFSLRLSINFLIASSIRSVIVVSSSAMICRSVL
jgi:hypothetical protein